MWIFYDNLIAYIFFIYCQSGFIECEFIQYLIKFSEKVLYGFGFGCGMGFSWKIMNKNEKKVKK